MAVRKVDFSRFEIQKDPASYNDWAWTGLTLGKLMVLRDALDVARKDPSHIANAISTDLFILADRAVAAAEKEIMP